MFRARILFAAFAAVVLVAVSGSAVLGDVALVNQWTFDDTLADSSGSGNTGTLSSGSATYVDGKFGQKAISLAAGQSVDDTAAANLPTTGTASWSMNVWVKEASPGLNSLSYLAGFGAPAGTVSTIGSMRCFVNYHSTATGYPATDGLYFAGHGADGTPSTTQPYGTDDFHMITATYERITGDNKVTLYYDGVQKYQGPWNFSDTAGTAALADAAAQIHVNANSYGSATNAGAYQEFTIWSGVLSQTEVTNLHSYNALTPEPGTLVLVVTGLLGLLAYAWRKRK